MNLKIYFLSLFLIFVSKSYCDEKVNIAVLELEGAGISNSESRIITSRLRTDLFNTNKFTVVERDAMDEILIEQGFQLTGCTTDECAVEVGKLLGVRVIVAGEIGKISDLYTISIRAIDVQTGKIIKTATEDCECDIKTVLTISVRNVAQILAGNKVQSSSYTKTDFNNSGLNLNGLSEWEKLGISRQEYFKFKNSGLSFEDWNKFELYKSEEQSITKNVIKSFIIPGWGNYSLKQNRGYAYFAFDIFFLSMGFYLQSKESTYLDKSNYYDNLAEQATTTEDRDFYLSKSYEYWDKRFEARDNSYLYFSLAALNRIISSIDTGVSTKKFNQVLKTKYSLQLFPNLNIKKDRCEFELSVNF